MLMHYLSCMGLYIFFPDSRARINCCQTRRKPYNRGRCWPCSCLRSSLRAIHGLLWYSSGPCILSGNQDKILSWSNWFTITQWSERVFFSDFIMMVYPLHSSLWFLITLLARRFLLMIWWWFHLMSVEWQEHVLLPKSYLMLL